MIISLLFLGVGYSKTEAAITLNSPSICSGSWTNCPGAFAHLGTFADARNNITGIWENYNITSTSTASSTPVVNSVRVGVDARANSCKTGAWIGVSVTGDGGVTWGPRREVLLPCLQQINYVNVTADYPWTFPLLSNGIFKVKADCRVQNPRSKDNQRCLLDWLPVEVVATP